MPTVQEMSRTLEDKRAELAKLFEDHKQTDGRYDLSVDQLSEVNKRNDELAELQDQFIRAADLERIAKDNAQAIEEMKSPKRPLFPGAPATQTRSDAYTPQTNFGTLKTDPGTITMGQGFVESKAYKAFTPGDTNQQISVDLPHEAYMISKQYGAEAEFKTTLSSTGLTSYERPPGIVLLGQQQLTVEDLVGSGTTNATTIRYMQEHSFTNAADMVAEGAAKPEAAWDLAEVDAAVRKVAVVSKVTDEMFSDYDSVRSYIDERMPFMIQTKAEQQILSGSGTAPQVRGILNTSGIQTQAKGADPGPDAVYKAMIKVQSVGFFQPDGVVINPTDWTDIRLLRTVDGIYIWGNPADPGPNRIWGLPVVVTTAITVNTALVGAFRLGAQVYNRRGVTMDATNSNEDDFKTNLIALRCERRFAVVVWRPLAFATVTGI